MTGRAAAAIGAARRSVDTMTGEATTRRLARHYHALMLSVAVVAAVLGAVSAVTAGNIAFLPGLLGGVGLFLLLANFAGAQLIFRPIGRYLSGDDRGGVDFASQVRRLPALSGLWVCGLTAAWMITHTEAVLGSWSALLHAPPGALFGTLLQCGVFAMYLGLYTYLLVTDYSVLLRRLLWQRGVALPTRRGRFVMRLIGMLAAIVLGPVLLASIDHFSSPAAMQDHVTTGMAMLDHPHRQYMAQTLHMDVLGALVLSALVVLLITRELSQAVDTLLHSMRQVDQGDFTTKSPVVTDDEFGVLTERFNQMLDGLAERERMRRTFERFVPESIASELIADEGAIAPQEREATVLFADIERFTQIASALAPREVVVLLNGYFSELARIIHERSGVITQFQGDAVLASFNMPTADPDHARHALEAALEIQRRLAQTTFGAGLRLRARIGISTGQVVGGTVGSADRLGFTVHGDTVNLAGRLEALNKDFGTRILVSARTAELLGSEFRLLDRGEVAVRGFDAPLRVFEPFDLSQ